jgi:hypothetical protein
VPTLELAWRLGANVPAFVSGIAVSKDIVR